MKSLSKRIFSTVLALSLALSLTPAVLAAEDQPERGVLRYEEHIAPKYEEAQPFYEGLAAVKQNGKWGYIDETGKTVIPFQYDIACVFSEGYAVVGKSIRTETDDKYDWDEAKQEYVVTGTNYYDVCQLGFIDKNNKLTWFEGGAYNDDGDWVDGPLEVWNLRGEEANPFAHLFHNGYIPLNVYGPEADLFGTDGKGREIPTYNWQVTEGIVITGMQEVEGGYQSFYNMAVGKEIDISWDEENNAWIELRPFNQGLAPVALANYGDDYDTVNTKWGFIDTSGKWVISPAYQNFMVSDTFGAYRVFGVTGMAMVQNAAGKWGGIDKSGKTVLPFQYDGLYPYAFGMAPFKQNGKWGFLDAKGNVAIPAQYVIVSGFSSNGYAVAYDGKSAFLIDTKGNAVPGADQLDTDTYFDFDDDDNIPLTFTPGEYVVIEENGKYGYGHITYLPALPAAGDMDSWAYPEVVAAIEENLVPTYLQNLYLNNITRDEFCDLVIQAISEVLDKEIADIVKEKTGKELSTWQQEYPFTDTTNSNVIAAYALGVVTGRGEKKFDPYATITRQEAAALLMRSAKVLGMDTSNASNAGYTDSDAVGVWFKDAVNYVHQINVMGSTGSGNTFSPTGAYTREQSYVTIYRLFKAVAGK